MNRPLRIELLEPRQLLAQVGLPGDAAPVVFESGDLSTATLGGKVYAASATGCPADAAHDGLEGVVVELLDETGTVLRTTTTNREGDYSFDGIHAGLFGIREIQPEGYAGGRAHVGQGGGSALTANLIGDIQVDRGEVLRHHNFCNIRTSTPHPADTPPPNQREVFPTNGTSSIESDFGDIGITVAQMVSERFAKPPQSSAVWTSVDADVDQSSLGLLNLTQLVEPTHWEYPSADLGGSSDLAQHTRERGSYSDRQFDGEANVGVPLAIFPTGGLAANL